ncbi:MAG: hypothetical protein CVU88_02940 [Firmicutes bacterium HGW-Firmicutes-13]|nr:MAG: hypothetical protein CVU88_02940 [Firmicutes bacterium HGW-Firmicutes-13]
MKNKSGYFKVLSASFIWGTIGAFARWSEFTPVELSFFRLLTAGLTLSLILPREQRLLIFYTKHYLLIFFSGILFALDTLLFFNALHLTTMSNAVLPYNMQPVFMAVLTPLFFKEKIKSRYILSFTFSLAGVGILLIPSIVNLSHTDAAGIGCALAGAFFLSIIALIAKFLNIQSITFVYYKMIIATLCLLPFIRMKSTLTLHSLVIIFVLGLVHTALAYILYYDGLKTVKIQHVVALTYFIPVVAALTGLFLFHEAVTVYIIFGGLLIVVNGIAVLFKN